MLKQYFLKIYKESFVFVLALFISSNAFAQNTHKKAPNLQASHPKLNWQINPIDHNLFVKNEGQFDGEAGDNEKVLYQASLGDAKAYFTAKGVIYKYNKTDGNPKSHQITESLSALWEQANPEVNIDAQQEQTYYYTYPYKTNGSIKASVFKKIIYRNIYPHIDIEYTFPTGKEGIKYALILHPGADLSQAKLNYIDAKDAKIDGDGNIALNTGIGEFTDHAPISYYENGESIRSSYVLKGTEESFKIEGKYDRSATIVIDPWSTSPIFKGSTYDKAYDLDYDNNGNIYVYGSYNPFQLVKMNSLGKILWTFNATTIDGLFYGDFAVDKFTGTSYIVEGAHASGARAIKVNTLGVPIATFPGNPNMNQMWRAVYDPCDRKLVIGAGGTSSNYQASILDTNMNAGSLSTVNVLGAGASGHSMVFTAIDPSGATCYMATAKSAVVDTANFNNVVLKLPLPSLSPTAYMVPDGYKFLETSSIKYVGPGTNDPNGMNGMAASPNWLYMYDGSTLKQANKNTGVINKSLNISSSSFLWGGLDADECDNIYLGNQSSIRVFSSSLTPIDTISLSGTVYDVVLGQNEQTLYACGNGFVSAFSIPSTPLSATSVVTAPKCGCNGSAKVTLKACNSVDTTGVTYIWSNGQTTQTATNLCSGTYTVSILSGCSIIYLDTIIIPNHFISINVPSASVCSGGSGVSLTASGATTYTWKPASGLSVTTGSIVNANPSSTATYTLFGTSGSCNDSVTIVITVNPTPTVSVTASPSTVCPNSSIMFKASGATTYSWSPSGVLLCSTCDSTSGSISKTTTFTVTGTSKGCSSKDSVTVNVFPVPKITIATTQTACDSLSGTATATVSGPGPYTYFWTPTGGTNTTAIGLGVGTYVISVKDTNGCIAKQSCVIKVTPSPTVTATSDSASCDSANGTAIASVTGGTSPFTYLWSPGGNTNSTDTKLGAGIYTVTVTDINGCKGKAFTIIEDTSAGISFSARNNVSCFGGKDGGATVSITKGTAPYVYTWSDGLKTSSVNTLTIGQYTVTVSDARNCVLIDTINIHQPTKLVGTIGAKNIIDVSCFGGSNGEISVNSSGGTPPYSYSWNNGQTGDTATGVQSITYSVTITDKNGCTAKAADSVGEPPKLIAIASSSSANCKNNGIVSATAIGGTPGYLYSWGALGNGATIYSLNKGTYTVTVTDAHGCTAKDSTTVDTLGQTASIKDTRNVSCNGGNNGAATVSVVGGDTSLYSYAWSPVGGTDATAINLTQGIYTITVTYLANLCQKTITDTIKQPAPIINTVKFSNVKCGGILTFHDTTTGGAAPYKYNWGPKGDTTAIVTLTTGNYTLTVTDSNGCQTTTSVTVPSTDPIANFTPVPDTISPGDSIKFVNLSSGANSWYWTFGDGNSSTDSLPYHIYTGGGSYIVYLKVTSSFGCTDSTSRTVYILESIKAPNVFTPNGDGMNDVFHVDAHGMNNYRIDIYNRWGLLIFEGLGENNDWTGRTMAGEEASVGTYYYIITASDNNGKSFNLHGFLELIR